MDEVDFSVATTDKDQDDTSDPTTTPVQLTMEQIEEICPTTSDLWGLRRK